ncbi:MAG: ABC transporter permease [Synergistales bacterium]|nr:ABC transporter permease [Synergistales bacterium]
MEVAPPFSKPSWLGKETSPTLTVLLDNETLQKRIDWHYEKPRHYKIKGRIQFSGTPQEASLIWETPEKQYILEDLSGYYDIIINLDARDITFKLNLGILPFENAIDTLFPSKGDYGLLLISDVPVGSMELELKLEGDKYGLLGTDQRGRDVFSLFLLGIRVSLIIGISATLIASFIGLSMGLVSGYLGGLTDALIMRGVDVLLSIPILPILMALAAVWGKGLWQLVLILSLFSWMGTARTVRAMTLSLRESCYIEGLKGLGASPLYILYRHLLPETLPLLLANIALGVPGAILAEASISFLGLSDPRVISWGRMLHEAHSFGAFSNGAWWLLIPPGFGIALLCLIFLDIGKYLEELVDPRLKGEKLE